jgi:aldehyde:ferredoxin oxidoreductase
MDHFSAVGRNLEKAFNTLHTDLAREDDLPPRRFQKEHVKSGPYQGSRADVAQFEEMLDEFYALSDWNEKTGMQTRAGLEKLGLQDIADKLDESMSCRERLDESL